jgi:hypothetical protein
MAIWNILHTIVIFYDHLVHFVFHLVHFFGFGNIFREKSGNHGIEAFLLLLKKSDNVSCLKRQQLFPANIFFNMVLFFHSPYEFEIRKSQAC